MYVEVCAGFKKVGGGAPSVLKSAAVLRTEFEVGGGGAFGAPMIVAITLGIIFFTKTVECDSRIIY